MDHHWTIPSEIYRPSKEALEETGHRDRVLESNEDPHLGGKTKQYIYMLSNLWIFHNMKLLL